MFSNFKIKTAAISAAHIGKSEHDESNELSEEFRKYLWQLCKDVINGKKFQELCFPEIKADIFISHSHADMGIVNGFAEWLEENFGLKVFIDSKVWKYADAIIYSLCRKYDIDYLGAAPHVYNMLTAALHNMIDATESVFFIESEHSVPYRNGMDRLTRSPWIYSEMECVRTVRKTPLAVYRPKYKRPITESPAMESAFNFIVQYPISLDNFQKLTAEDLKKWDEEYHSVSSAYDPYPLDALYKFKCPNALRQAEEMRKAYGDEIDRVYRGRDNRRGNETCSEMQLPCAVCPYHVSQEYENAEPHSFLDDEVFFVE